MNSAPEGARSIDLTAARRHRIVITCHRLGIPVLADLGYGGNFAVPVRRRPGKQLTATEKSLNKAHARLRHPVERGIASLKTWRIFRHASLQSHLAHVSSQSHPHP
ncbi:transposase family protein [Streptomyces sp. NPDC091376]|uniref:transposase family protein n=1 Tax=Streptomyces sp. NPDC091376 TaxID=3365994 RepID=UPI003806073C